jgi:excisionase family DNA binding protein
MEELRMGSKERERLYRLSEAAAATGHAEKTWRQWVWRRRVSFVKIGRSVRIPESVIEELIERGTVPAIRH